MLNKFLKDVVLRYKLCTGYRVTFVPGWDCHGLPIELKAVRENTVLSPQHVRAQVGKDLYCIVWTTAPWTIPSNEAVVFNPNARYAIVSSTMGKHFLVGRQFIPHLCDTLSESLQIIVNDISGEELAGCTYLHPIRCSTRMNNIEMPFLPGTFVDDSKGTGLVHCAPCHGREDFDLGRRFDLPLNQVVDDNGQFMSSTGPDLAGLPVLTEGSEKVLQLLGPAIIRRSEITHSYPCDWRTKSPVITRISDQWFLETSRLKSTISAAYDTVQVLPDGYKSSMLPFLFNRPRWCISRQRFWGVPIPVLINSANNVPIVDLDFIEHIASRVENSGCDFWFNEPLDVLVPPEFWKNWCTKPGEVIKNTDVFDVWFDSGLSWQTMFKGGKNHPKADLYLEGQDQLRGWFSSSLILSAALVGQAPYREVIVHGFTTDSEGRKMSKSVGNVVSPKELLLEHNGCIDVLRRWAACSGLDAVCTIGHKEIKQHADRYKLVGYIDDFDSQQQALTAYFCSFAKLSTLSLSTPPMQLRNSLRFMLGNLVDFDAVYQLTVFHGELIEHPVVSASQLVYQFATLVSKDGKPNHCLRPLDRAVLCWLSSLVDATITNYYPRFRFDQMFAHVDQLIDRLSGVYHNSIKDILYCDSVDSHRRRGVQTVLWLTSECLITLLAPLLPYLGEEVESSLTPGSACSLLERCSLSTLSPASNSPSGEPQSDWLTCLGAMQRWKSFETEATSLELVDRLKRLLLTTSPAEAHLSKGDLTRFHVDITVPDRHELADALRVSTFSKYNLVALELKKGQGT